MATQIGEFMRQYRRKAQGGGTEPNDRWLASFCEFNRDPDPAFD